LKIRFFGTIFLLNEKSFFIQNDVVSCTVHKKNRRNGVVLNGIVRNLLPLTRKGKGRRFSFPSFAAFVDLYLSLPLPPTCPKTQHNPYPLMAYPMMKKP